MMLKIVYHHFIISIKKIQLRIIAEENNTGMGNESELICKEKPIGMEQRLS